jgi:hypothetical protein
MNRPGPAQIGARRRSQIGERRRSRGVSGVAREASAVRYTAASLGREIMYGSRRLRAGAAGRSLVLLVVATLLWTGALVPAARAAVVASEAALEASPGAGADRARVAAFLAREDVRGQLEAFGVDPDRARERVALLSDAEVSQVAGQIDQLPAGGSAGLAIAIVALVLVIILILELAGVTDIFTGIGPRR